MINYWSDLFCSLLDFSCRMSCCPTNSYLLKAIILEAENSSLEKDSSQSCAKLQKSDNASSVECWTPQGSSHIIFHHRAHGVSLAKRRSVLASAEWLDVAPAEEGSRSFEMLYCLGRSGLRAEGPDPAWLRPPPPASVHGPQSSAQKVTEHI